MTDKLARISCKIYLQVYLFNAKLIVMRRAAFNGSAPMRSALTASTGCAGAA
jgi:hypothetical protein